MATSKLMTAEDLWELEDDGYRHELIRGELTSMPPTGDSHGRTLLRLSWYVEEYLRAHPEATGWGGDTGFVIEENPDTVLAPDIALISTQRDIQPGGFLRLVPELVIENLSPSDRASDVNAKTGAYLSAGVRRVWLIDPQRASVTVYAADRPPDVLGRGDTLRDAEVFPDLVIPLDSLFS